MFKKAAWISLSFAMFFLGAVSANKMSLTFDKDHFLQSMILMMLGFAFMAKAFIDRSPHVLRKIYAITLGIALILILFGIFNY